MVCSTHSANGFNNFYPSIVEGFDFGFRTITLVCTAPPYLVAAVAAVMVAFSSDRFQERGFHIGAPLSVAIIGFIITVSTLNVPARYFASFLFICGSFSINSLVFTWASATLNQTPEKRACATALINTIAQLGSIWSAYFFRPQDSPRYTMAMLLMMAFSVIALCTALFMKAVLRNDNEKLRRTAEEDGTLAELYTL
jgi:predicted MFS family arabinose efflux permease